MATITGNTNLVLNGTTPFNVGSTPFSWFNLGNGVGWLESVDVFSDTPLSSFVVNVSLDGSWFLGALRFNSDDAVGAALSVNINDNNTTGNRNIDFLFLRGNSSTVTLSHTGVNSISGSGNNTITTGDRWVGSILLDDGNDTVTIGDGGSASVVLGGGTNFITTTTGWVDTIVAYDGNDTAVIGAGAGTNSIHLGGGTNVFAINGDADSIGGGNGNDTVVVNVSGFSRSIDLGHGTNTFSIQGSVTSIVGRSGNDTVVVGASGSAHSIDTGGGNDLINVNGNSFVDSILADDGNDTINVSAGPDGVGYINLGNDTNSLTIGAVVVDMVHGGHGNDTITINPGGEIAMIKSSTGNDTFNLTSAANPTIGDAGGIETITSTISRSIAGYGVIENLTLLNVATAISGVGNGLANVITGNNFNNTLIGGFGTDTLRGALGNDTYVLENGADVVSDTGGTDTATSTISRTLAAGGLTAVENLILVNAATALNGFGNNLNNTITGNNFNNVLSGGLGNDVLIGNLGRDITTGGGGNDIFRFGATSHSPVGVNADVVTDFDDFGDDRIDLVSVFGGTLAYRHNLGFTAAGQVRINDIAGADVLVEVNTGGTLAADMQIRLTATTLASMNAADFFL